MNPASGGLQRCLGSFEYIVARDLLQRRGQNRNFARFKNPPAEKDHTRCEESPPVCLRNQVTPRDSPLGMPHGRPANHGAPPGIAQPTLQLHTAPQDQAQAVATGESVAIAEELEIES